MVSKFQPIVLRVIPPERQYCFKPVYQDLTLALNSNIMFRMSPSNAKLLADAIKGCDVNIDKVDMIDNVVDMVNIIEKFRK